MQNRASRCQNYIHRGIFLANAVAGRAAVTSEHRQHTHIQTSLLIIIDF